MQAVLKIGKAGKDLYPLTLHGLNQLLIDVRGGYSTEMECIHCVFYHRSLGKQKSDSGCSAFCFLGGPDTASKDPDQAATSNSLNEAITYSYYICFILLVEPLFVMV